MLEEGNACWWHNFSREDCSSKGHHNDKDLAATMARFFFFAAEVAA